MGTLVLLHCEGDLERADACVATFSAQAARMGVSLTIMGHAQTVGAEGLNPSPVLARIEPKHTTGIDAALAEFEDDLRVGDRDALHVKRTLTCVRELRAACAWKTPQDMKAQEVRAYLKEEKKKGNGPKTLNTKRGYLSRFGRFCVKQGWLAVSPVDAVSKARVPKRAARIVPTEDQVRALIRAARKDWRTGDRWLVYLTAATTGLRMGTLKKLQWAHVRIDEHPPKLEIPGSILKGRSAGTVYLPEETAAALRTHRGSKPRKGRVFSKVPKWDGFERDRKRAGLEKGTVGECTLSFHSLRHFASNRMLWAGGGFTDAERAAQNTHATIGQTRDIYTAPAHKNFGERVFSLQPLMGQGVAQRLRARKKTAHPEMPLDKGGESADTRGVHMTNASPEFHESLNPARSGRGSCEQCSEVRSGSGSKASDLSFASVSGSRGASISAIGVGGFETPTPIRGNVITEEALKLAENAIRVLRSVWDSVRPGPSAADLNGGSHAA